MTHRRTIVRAWLSAALGLGLLLPATARAQDVAPESRACGDCHARTSSALVMEWRHSRHAAAGIGCYDCHHAEKGEPDAWQHHGAWISTLVTPRDCAACHEREVAEFTASHHARAGEIIQSLDNVLAERACGMPGNISDAVNGCWQCHGSIVRFQQDAAGAALDPETWPNSGMGRLNPDGSKGSCHACHSRHDFNAKLARSPENCGKCHMGPDHPQIEIYNESKHGIAFYANRDRMALDQEGDWILGRDYSAAPTCATCHISGFVAADGTVKGNSHDVGERISWTLRPVVSTKLNLVEYTDGTKEDFAEPRPLPRPGDKVMTQEKYVAGGKLASRDVERTVARVRGWDDRRAEMKAMCSSCHAATHVENFYRQYDGLVALYNEKFAKPSQTLVKQLEADQVLNPRSPFGTPLGWTFYELWHHEGRRARHGASMMGPDYTHWHGMYEVAKHFYTRFLPEVVETAERRSPAMGEKYRQLVDEMLARDEHRWLQGMSASEFEELRKAYQQRYQQK